MRGTLKAQQGASATDAKRLSARWGQAAAAAWVTVTALRVNAGEALGDASRTCDVTAGRACALRSPAQTKHARTGNACDKIFMPASRRGGGAAWR